MAVSLAERGVRGTAAGRLDLAGRDMMFLAEMPHSPLQLAMPGFPSNFHADPAQARAVRHRLLRDRANRGAIVAIHHFPPPASSRIGKSGAGIRFEPLS